MKKGQQPGQINKALVQMGKTPDACWRWLGAADDKGVGKKEYCGKSLLARRWIWIQLFGPIPEGLVISPQVCGNAWCVNPWHLRAVTQAACCRAGVTTTLTADDVREIRVARAHRTPNMRRHLAEKHGVSVSTISDIWGRRSWRKPKAFYGAKKNAPAERSIAANH